MNKPDKPEWVDCEELFGEALKKKTRLLGRSKHTRGIMFQGNRGQATIATQLEIGLRKAEEQAEAKKQHGPVKVLMKDGERVG